jgi:hypothetical protein
MYFRRNKKMKCILEETKNKMYFRRNKKCILEETKKMYFRTKKIYFRRNKTKQNVF